MGTKCCGFNNIGVRMQLGGGGLMQLAPIN